MTRRATAIAMLALSTVGLSTARSYAGTIKFTGDAFYSQPLAIENAQGAPCNTACLVNIGDNNVPLDDGGFDITDGSFTYTYVDGDPIGESVFLTWTIVRPVDYLTESYNDIDEISADVDVGLPKSWEISNFVITLGTVGDPGSTTMLQLGSSFQERMHNRGLMRTTAVATAAPPRHRASLAAAQGAGTSSGARS